MTRVAEWWRGWLERRIPLMESEPSRVDLLDGVGLTPSPDEPVQPEPEESSGPEAAVDSPESAEPTPSDERRLTPDA